MPCIYIVYLGRRRCALNRSHVQYRPISRQLSSISCILAQSRFDSFRLIKMRDQANGSAPSTSHTHTHGSNPRLLDTDQIEHRCVFRVGRRASLPLRYPKNSFVVGSAGAFWFFCSPWFFSYSG
jgi:hypothetical protein